MFIIFVCVMLANRLTGCISHNPIMDNESMDQKEYIVNIYSNPVIHTSSPDPTVIKSADGCFYLYSTEDIRNIPIYKSYNLVEWTYIGTAFTEESRPQLVEGGSLWAPDINYIDGNYVLYYSNSKWRREWESAIGVAISTNPEGPFIDQGKIITSKEIGVQNSIDPFYYEENGHKYLFWGGLKGLYAIELTPDGLSLMPGADKYKIANNGLEGCYIQKHGNCYYLFASNGSCCEGARSTYNVICARSDKLLGPYMNKNGELLLDDKWESFIYGNSFVAGPGHNSEFIQDDNGQEWVLYHGYLRSDPDAGRVVFLDKVYWDEDGWPYINDHTPSHKNDKPHFAE